MEVLGAAVGAPVAGLHARQERRRRAVSGRSGAGQSRAPFPEPPGPGAAGRPRSVAEVRGVLRPLGGSRYVHTAISTGVFVPTAENGASLRALELHADY